MSWVRVSAACFCRQSSILVWMEWNKRQICTHKRKIDNRKEKGNKQRQRNQVRHGNARRSKINKNLIRQWLDVSSISVYFYFSFCVATDWLNVYGENCGTLEMMKAHKTMKITPTEGKIGKRIKFNLLRSKCI